MAFGETIPNDEEARFRGYADEVANIQKARAAKSGEARRGRARQAAPEPREVMAL